MQTTSRRFKSTFIREPAELSASGSLSEQTAVVRLLRRVLPSPAISSHYRRKQFAARRIEAVSGGMFALASSVYRGNDHRHWITCRTCQNEFRVSYNELREHGSATLCPFCYPSEITDLTRIGSDQRIQSFTYWLSKQNAMIMLSRECPGFIGGIDQWARFYCCACGDAYDAIIRSFLHHAGEGNGCPRCHQALGKPLSSP